MHDARKFAWMGSFRDAVCIGFDCSQGMEAHGAGACCALCVEAKFRTVASPGTMLAPALSLDREQQKQRILTPVSAKATPAQRHVHHCSICGTARHTHTGMPAHTHTCARTHTHTRMRTRTYIQIQTRTCIHTGAHTQIHMHAHKNRHTRARTNTYIHTNTQAHTRTKTHTHTHTHTGTHARAHTYTRTNTQAHTRAHTHTHVHTHVYACTRFVRDGLRQFFSVASDTPTLVQFRAHGNIKVCKLFRQFKAASLNPLT